MKNEIPTPERAELLKLRQEGMNREDIAKYYGVALSRVKRWIAELDIPAPTVSRKAQPRFVTEGVAPPEDDGMTLIERAKKILGRRVGEDYRGYLLDGRPVRVDILVNAAGLAVRNLN